jgi:hypothetical protein
MRPVKLPGLITISCFFAIISNGQLRLPLSNSIQPDMEKVLKDYPNQFKNLIAEEVSQTPQTTDYRSSLLITGAQECSVTKYSSKKKEIYSWQALMLTTEDFDKAKRKFRALFDQLNNISVRLSPVLVAHFKGVYESPTEAKNFASIVFSTGENEVSLKQLKIELRLESEMLEWKLRIIVYEKEREDNEQGEIKE